MTSCQSENGCEKWHFLVWNRVRIWRHRAAQPQKEFPGLPPSSPLGCFKVLVRHTNFMYHHTQVTTSISNRDPLSPWAWLATYHRIAPITEKKTQKNHELNDFFRAEFCHTVILSIAANMPSSLLCLAHLRGFDWRRASDKGFKKKAKPYPPPEKKLR